MIKKWFAGICLALTLTLALASNGNFLPIAGATANIAATTTSANVAISVAGQDVLVTNPGTVAVFVRLCAPGDSTTASATTDMPIAPGWSKTLSRGNATSASAVTASGTTTVYFSVGTGSAI